MLRILIVEDDADLRHSLSLTLRRGGHQVQEAESAAKARPLLSRVDLLLTDLRLPDGEGTALLVDGLRANPRLQSIVMTGYGTIESAIRATRSGARDYLLKPFEMDVLKRQVAEVDTFLGAQEEAARAQAQGHGGLLGRCAAMQRVFLAIDAAAASSAPVLVEGETGTGKELVAMAIHQRSARRQQPFVPVNLAALPAELLESELFGHERGAFTGASARRAGRFALASGGTLLLDEINSLPLALQPKLLRVLETRELWPVGATRSQRADVRVLAASNEPLAALVEQGRFRADLYYRLNVLRIELPPLRERPEDVPLIARALLDREDMPRPAPGTPVELSSEALAWLSRQRWPGNVRELKNLLERTLLQAPVLSRIPPRLERADLDGVARAGEVAAAPFKDARSAATDEWRRSVIVAALRQAGGNRAQAAKILQMNRSALFKLLKRLAIEE